MAHRYQAATIRSLIAADRSDHDGSREHARHAIEAAATTESPFRHHRKLSDDGDHGDGPGNDTADG